MQLRTTRGVTVIEVLVGVAIFSVVMVFMVHTLNLFFSNAAFVHERTKAMFLATEGQEMVRFIRDDDWNEISARTVGTTYSLAASAGAISLTTTPEVIDSAYTRTIIFTSVYRNANDDIVSATAPGAVVDAGSRYATVTISWGTSETIVLQALVTNIFDI